MQLSQRKTTAVAKQGGSDHSSSSSLQHPVPRKPRVRPLHQHPHRRTTLSESHSTYANGSILAAASLFFCFCISISLYCLMSMNQGPAVRLERDILSVAHLLRGAKGDAALKDASVIIDMRELTRTLPFDNPDGGAWKQGWDVQPVPVDAAEHPLTVFVIPHSHCDPGWIKTFDEYFRQQTSNIITAVVDALQKDSRRKFIWAEISYFSWWWEEQTEEKRSIVKQLLKNKQLEFVTGGWVQPDEANSELYAMEIQLQEGHDWIRKNVGAQYIPKYGWSIDPFGYSPTAAYLWKKYDFKAMLIQRVHYAVKKELASKKQLEFYWRQTWDDTGDYDIFTHVMPFFSYDIPHTCGPDPSICCQFDFNRHPFGGQTCPWRKNPQKITEQNVKERALLLLDQYRKKAALYRSNVVLVPLGDDFRYDSAMEAENQYTNYQAIFDYINANVPGVKIQFGTLSEYFQAAMGAFQPPLLKGSFFTYADVNEDYWSGYFTSRVFDKALDRQLERTLYAAETMGATKLELQQPRRELSLFQHHDGVTGTAKDHVVEDYAKRMYDAIGFTQKWILDHLRKQKIVDVKVPLNELQPCFKSSSPRGMSHNLCGDKGDAIVYNPLETDQKCGSILVPGHKFKAVTLPCELPGRSIESKTKIVFDPNTGLMKEPIREEWKVWKVNRGGAYLFFPGQLVSYDLKDHELQVEGGGYIVYTKYWKRTIVEREIPTEFGSKATVLDFIYEVRLNQDNEEWFVRFTGNIANGGVFHTDLNGFNFDTHHFRADMPIQSQVFPMPTLASIEDSSLRMTVISEHAQGTASLQDGAIDVWLDRRLSQDDSRGLGQGVQDNRPTRTRLRLVLESEGYDRSGEFNVTKLCRRMWDELQHPLELFGKHTEQAPKEEERPAKPEDWRHAHEMRRAAREQKRISLADERAKAAKKSVPAKSDSNLVRDAINKILGTDFRGLFSFGKDWNRGVQPKPPEPRKPPVNYRGQQVVSNTFTVDNTVVPFVFMVYKRVDYLQKAIESLRKSDFPKSRVPLIISHDGQVKEVVDFVNTLKEEFQVTQLFHEHSCFDHPDTFPGNDESLNVGFKGDTYGNPRSPWITCCKHHFTWMMKTIFELDMKDVDTFFFLEEDYIVAPTIYSALVAGLNAMEQEEAETKGGFFGICFDPTLANVRRPPYWLDNDTWYADYFHSGPMTMNRKVYSLIRQHAEDYCRFDDYNWDWSLVHMQGKGLLPHTVLMAGRPQVKHIGIKEGMHSDTATNKRFSRYIPRPEEFEKLETRFLGTKFFGSAHVNGKPHNRGYGGWGHPADQEHCLKLLQ